MSALPSRVKASVRQRAQGVCEYCRVHEDDAGATSTYQCDHVRPQHLFALDNPARDDLSSLAYSCPRCNSHKAGAVDGIDHDTGRREPLFNPRVQEWHEHFTYTPAGFIFGMSATGRATAGRLHFNDAIRVKNRAVFSGLKRWPR